MKKRFISAILTLTMIVSLTPVVPAFAANGSESPFTDVATDYWAYDTIVTLTNAGVINGIGDGLFAPEDTLTKAEMTKLLVCAVGTYDETVDYHDNFADVADGEWYTEYIANGIAVGMYGSSYSRLFEPDTPLSRGECAIWMMNTLGIESGETYTYPDITDAEVAEAVSNATAVGLIAGYEDGTYRPDGSLTRSEAATIILRIMNYMSSLTAIREDSANEIVLNKNVVIAESSDTVNVPLAADEEECSVTFDNADDTLKGLAAGDILYMDISSTLPNGLVGKIADISAKSDTVTLWLEAPELEEVIESIDISAYFGVSEDMIGDDGEIEVTAISDESSSLTRASASNATALNTKSVGSSLDSVESKDNDVDFDADVDGEVSNLSVWHRSVYANANANITSSLHFETPSYSKKDGVYAAVDMSLGAMLNFILNIANGEVTTFYVSASVTTDIESTAGYNKSGSKSASYDLPTITVPVAGVLNVVIKSKLTVSADGEVSIVSNAELENITGMYYSISNGLTTYSYTFADADLSVDAEGSVKAGPEVDVAVNLCKITIPLVNKTIFDGFDIADASFKVGVGIEGELSRSIDVSLSNTSANITLDDTDDEIHACYFCVEGDIFYYYSGEAGLSDDVQKIFDKISSSGKKLRKTLADEEKKLLDWHLSTGDGYTNEFELEECPHVLYKVSASATDASDESALSDLTITAKNTASGDVTAFSASSSTAYTCYLAPGTYTVTAQKEDYKPDEMKLTVTDSAKTCAFELEREEPDYVKIYEEFLANEKFVGKSVYYSALDGVSESDGFLYTESEDDNSIQSITDAYVFDCDNDSIPELVIEALMQFGSVYLIYEYDGETVNKQTSHLAAHGGSGYSYTATFTKAPDGIVYLKVQSDYHGTAGELSHYGYIPHIGNYSLISIADNGTALHSYFEYEYYYNGSVSYDCIVTNYACEYVQRPSAVGMSEYCTVSKTNSFSADYDEYKASYFSGYIDYIFGYDKGANLAKYYVL